jgi:prepilin-type processing-associated H-X9-DG protein
VELIVSVSIVAVLAGLLLPAITRARTKAKETLCTNNLKQIHTGLGLYLGDNSGRFPAGIVWPEGKIRVWNSNDFLGGVDGRDTNALPARLRPLFPHLGASKVFKCAADVGFDFVAKDGLPVRPSQFDVIGVSYLYNSGELIEGAPQSTDGLGGKQLEWVKRPARYALVYEPPLMASDQRHPNTFLVYWHRARKPGSAHGEVDNERGPRVSPVLFVDGHVNFIDCTGSYGTFPSSVETRQQP